MSDRLVAQLKPDGDAGLAAERYPTVRFELKRGESVLDGKRRALKEHPGFVVYSEEETVGGRVFLILVRKGTEDENRRRKCPIG